MASRSKLRELKLKLTIIKQKIERITKHKKPLKNDKSRLSSAKENKRDLKKEIKELEADLEFKPVKRPARKPLPKPKPEKKPLKAKVKAKVKQAKKAIKKKTTKTEKGVLKKERKRRGQKKQEHKVIYGEDVDTELDKKALKKSTKVGKHLNQAIAHSWLPVGEDEFMQREIRIKFAAAYEDIESMKRERGETVGHFKYRKGREWSQFYYEINNEYPNEGISSQWNQDFTRFMIGTP